MTVAEANRRVAHNDRVDIPAELGGGQAMALAVVDNGQLVAVTDDGDLVYIPIGGAR